MMMLAPHLIQLGQQGGQHAGLVFQGSVKGHHPLREAVVIGIYRILVFVKALREIPASLAASEGTFGLALSNQFLACTTLKNIRAAHWYSRVSIWAYP